MKKYIEFYLSKKMLMFCVNVCILFLYTTAFSFDIIEDFSKYRIVVKENMKVSEDFKSTTDQTSVRFRYYERVSEKSFLNDKFVFKLPKHSSFIVEKIEDDSVKERLTQSQQEITISGVVEDENGVRLPGATIVIKGTNEGMQTGFDGEFEISVNADDTIVVQYVGYEDEEVVVSELSDTNDVRIRLRVNVSNLNKVVVTALGIKRNTKSLGYSVTQVDSKDIVSGKTPNVMSSLQGRVAGVDISPPNSGPAGSSRVIIRGNSQLTGNNQPLFVIDGVPMDNNNLGNTGTGQYAEGFDSGDGLSSLNPSDIASVSVLKGPSAAALYGNRGSNGVILITTKSADQKGLGVEYNSNFNAVYIGGKFDDYQRVYGAGINGEVPTTQASGRAAARSAWGARLDSDMQTTIYDGTTRPYGNVDNNILSFFRTGHTLNNSLQVTSNTEKNSLVASLSYLTNADIVPKSDMNRFTIMLKEKMKIGNFLTVDSRVNYSQERVDNRPGLAGSPSNIAYNMIGLAPSFDQKWLEDGYQDEVGRYNEWGGGEYNLNPYWVLNKGNNFSNKNRLLGHIRFDFKINPYLNFEIRSGVDTYSFNSEFSIAPFTPLQVKGRLNTNSIENTEYNTQAMLRFNKDLNEDINISAFLAGNILSQNSKALSLIGTNQFIPEVNAITNYSELIPGYSNYRRQINSLYGSVNFSYKDYLYLEATLRNDWSSTLSKGNNSFMYPSVSSSFVFSDIIGTSKLFSYGKLRLSYAQVGGDTDAYRLNLNYGLNQSPNSFRGFPLGTITSSEVPNRKLKPTRTNSYEIGGNFRFLDNKISLDIAYYLQNTDDQIISLPISGATGYNYAVINAGRIQNQGIEVALNYTAVSTSDFGLDFFANAARNINQVVELHPEIQSLVLSQARWAGSYIEARVGQPYGVIIGKKILRTPDGQVINDKTTGLPRLTNDLEVVGTGVNQLTSGLGFNARYKGLSLSALFSVNLGKDIYSMSDLAATSNGTSIRTLEGRKEWYESEEQRKAENISQRDWTPTGGFVAPGVIDENQGEVDADGNPLDPNYVENAKIINPTNYWRSFQQDDGTPEPFIYDASFVKLRELTLTYDMKKSFLKNSKTIKGITLGLYARNLFTLYSNVPNIDPESGYNNSNGQGFEYGSLPSRRTTGISLNIKF